MFRAATDHGAQLPPAQIRVDFINNYRKQLIARRRPLAHELYDFVVHLRVHGGEC